MNTSFELTCLRRGFGRQAVDSQTQCTGNAPASTLDVLPHANPHKEAGHGNCTSEFVRRPSARHGWPALTAKGRNLRQRRRGGGLNE